jgi:AraC family transcriptional regulator, regulatory protein of adaptative response / methylated-DNA-[protein]-cysteine methyltransferase
MSDDPYSLIARVLEHLVTMPEPQPTLAQLSASVGLSPSHFQKLFKEWVGVSPKKFIQHLSLEAAKTRLRASANVLDASLEAGLSGPGRLHDLMVTIEAMTPGEYKQGGEGLNIFYGQHSTPFGDCTLFLTQRGVCGLEFSSSADALVMMQARWPRASFRQAEEQTGAVVRAAFVEATNDAKSGRGLSLYVSGSAFQLQVWKALLAIPSGGLTSYGDIARRLGMGTQGARAVGSAVGSNPIGWLIPCHRVIRQTGALSGYRWGLPRKLAMVGWEASRNEKAQPAQ